MNSGTYKKRKQQMKDTLTSEWDLLAEEVRVYRPEAFDRLRKSFFGFFKNRSMQFIFGREISKGNSPARDWLSANGYPNREEVEHLL
ncbi:MAG: hypothetical protein OEW04_12800, partial [Nitrospirota bacterium]|nr:hypothetical protein [Nitrospirota bacterium]